MSESSQRDPQRRWFLVQRIYNRTYNSNTPANTLEGVNLFPRIILTSFEKTSNVVDFHDFLVSCPDNFLLVTFCTDKTKRSLIGRLGVGILGNVGITNYLLID